MFQNFQYFSGPKKSCFLGKYRKTRYFPKISIFFGKNYFKFSKFRLFWKYPTNLRIWNYPLYKLIPNLNSKWNEPQSRMNFRNMDEISWKLFRKTVLCGRISDQLYVMNIFHQVKIRTKLLWNFFVFGRKEFF